MKTPRKKAGEAARKKSRPRKKAAPRDLTKAEAYYVEAHFGLKKPEVVAAELGVPVESVRAYADQLAEAGFKPERKPKTPVQKAGFATHKGAVSMTPASSERGDEFRGVTADGSKPARKRNENFFKKRASSVHVINPDLPVN